jgi:hypothetical protein
MSEVIIKNLKVDFERASDGDILVVVKLNLEGNTNVKWYPKINQLWTILQALALADYLNCKKLNPVDIKAFRLGKLDRKTANLLKGLIDFLTE